MDPGERTTIVTPRDTVLAGRRKITGVDGSRLSRLVRQRIVVAVAAGLGMSLVPVTPADAAPLGCGSVLTTDTTLETDLTCSGDALIIGSDGITVNLNRHAITGTGTGTGITDRGFDNVTIRNGTISRFARAAFLDTVRDVTFRRIRILGPGQGIEQQAAPDVRFTEGALINANLRAMDGPGNRIDHSLLVNSPVSFESDSNQSEISHNVLTNSPIGLNQSDRVLIADNTLVGSPIRGISASRFAMIRDNWISGAETGVYLLDESPGTQVVGNTFVGNGIGLVAQILAQPSFPAVVVSGNSFVNNDAAGVLLESVLVSVPVVANINTNRFIANGFRPAGREDRLGRPVADGLHIAVTEVADVTVADNATRNNASYGIFADPGTVHDGGGNTSVGNPNGCLGVTCQGV
jgi:hypothetical protein